MRMVIDIPEETMNEIKDNAMFAGSISSDIRWDVTSAIVNGTPIPEGCGRLIDGDALRSEMIQTFKKYCNANAWDVCVECVRRADTIIEADKKGEQE